MIDKFVKKFMDAKEDTITGLRLKKQRPDNYKELVKGVIDIISDKDDCDDPDPKRITVIDDGNYQGTLLFIIGDQNYSVWQYWAIFVSYGSCSGCDTLCGISGYRSEDEPITFEEATQYWTLMLHMVQGMKEIGNCEDKV